MIATRDIGAYAAERLLKLDFNGKRTQELQGERDLTLHEVVVVIAKGLRKPDLRYVQFPYDQVEKVLGQMGAPAKNSGQLHRNVPGDQQRHRDGDGAAIGGKHNAHHD